MTIRIELENRIAELTRAKYPQTGIEYLVGRLSSLCTDDQLAVLAVAISEEVGE